MEISSTQILHGLVHQHYSLVYQPQYDARTLRIVGAEALLRWDQPGVNASPVDIVSNCLKHGLIEKLGETIVHRVCAQIATWQRIGFVVPVAINMHPTELTSKYPGMVLAAISDAGIQPGLIEIEITEGSDFPDHAIALENMARLTEEGIGFIADDFGTGFSSLQNIARFPICKIKIDRSFVRNAPHSHKDRAIISAVIKLAQELQIAVLGEGAETTHEVAMLRSLGCHLFQGFYFAKPLPPDVFYSLLTSNTNKPNYIKGVTASEKLAHC